MNFIETKLNTIVSILTRTSRKLDRYFIIGIVGITSAITYMAILREKVKQIENRLIRLEDTLLDQIKNKDTMSDFFEKLFNKVPPPSTLSLPRSISIQSSFADHSPGQDQDNMSGITDDDDDANANANELQITKSDKSTNTNEFWYCTDFEEILSPQSQSKPIDDYIMPNNAPSILEYFSPPFESEDSSN